jgi:hypothetical protein
MLEDPGAAIERIYADMYAKVEEVGARRAMESSDVRP